MSEQKQYVATISFQVTIYAEDKKIADTVAQHCVPNHIHMQGSNYSARYKDGKVDKVGAVTTVRKPDPAEGEPEDED